MGGVIGNISDRDGKCFISLMEEPEKGDRLPFPLE